MTQEQINAFQEWWSKSSIACDKGTICRDAFASGWEAAVAAVNRLARVPDAYAELITDGTRGAAFDAWWARETLKCFCSEQTGRHIWNYGWTHATLGQFARAEAEIRAKLLALAVEVFKEGDTQRAQIILDLSDIRHNIWPEPL